MIIDEVLTDKKFRLVVPRPVRERVAAAWRRARRFRFSPAASRLAGGLAIGAGDLVVSHRQFALPPFPATYVEVDSREFFSSVPDEESIFGWAEHNTDDRFGYLIDGSEVYGFGASEYEVGADGKLVKTGRPQVGMQLWSYRLLRPGEDAGEDTFRLDVSKEYDWRWWKSAMLLGRAASTYAGQKAADDVLRSCAVRAFSGDLPSRLSHESLIRAIQGSMGDVRNLWALLLWLNQPRRVVYGDVPGERRLRGGKLTTFSPYRTVEIELGAKYRSIRRAYLAGAPRVTPGEHDVRGEFHHRGGLSSGCSHEWPLIPEPSPSGKDHGVSGVWECQKCGRRRWFVESHRRGDPSRPIVHDYSIITEKEKA